VSERGFPSKQRKKVIYGREKRRKRGERERERGVKSKQHKKVIYGRVKHGKGRNKSVE